MREQERFEEHRQCRRGGKCVMKVIIVGCGKIGYTIAKALSAEKGINVTVVDIDPGIFDDSGEPLDVIFVKGNGVSEKTLIDSGAKSADLVISTTNADEVNILCCIMAKYLGTKHTIARVRDPEYSLEFNKLWKDLGIDIALNPELQTAREISRLLRYPAADGIVTFVGGRVEMVSVKASEAAEYFTGKSISQIFDKKMGILIALVERNGIAVIPHGDFVFNESDIVMIVGRPSQIMKFFTNIQKYPKKAQEIMVIGGGKITRYLAELLKRHTVKANLKIVEKDHRKCEVLYEALSSGSNGRRCMFINGDGTDEELLKSEEIDKMDAFVCLTDRDEENTIISLYALRMGVKKVITKVNNIHLNMIRNLGLGLGSIITPQDITLDTIARYIDGLKGVVGNNAKTMHRIFSGDDGNVEAIEFHVNKKAKCLGIPIKALSIKREVLICCIVRNSEIIIPSGETQMQTEDIVIIISKNNEIRELDDILLKRTEV